MLEIKNLSVSIENHKILKDFSLNIKAGEVHALMGLNGSGKSTLVKTIAGHFECKITAGEILYKGENLKDIEVENRANKGIFLSFQNPCEIEGVNNSYFLKSALNAKRVYENKEELDTLEFAKLLKEKLDFFNIDKSLLKRDLNAGFSGGEKKKNELIQIMILKPDLILLDEIDSGLDIDAIKTVSAVINSLLDGKIAVLMITHYDRLLEEIKPDFVHILDKGKISLSGDHSLALELDKKGFEGIGKKDEKYN
ncbi:MAG: Fe-S cluster assembly ATPase SufC [Campylobacteraceae bacterium]|nr:Fe-S cluster assembly ATPase SufC [Campylobacteraceae bacterium]